MNLNQLIRPADARFDAIAAEIYAERADLREAYRDPSGAEFAKWLASSGIVEYPERLGGFFPPIPPPELRHLGSGGRTEHSHLWTSLGDLETVLELASIYHTTPLGEVGAVLDFGCGCGRLTRWLPAAFPAADVFGTDVRPPSIAWCNEHLAGQFLTQETTPPLQLPDDSVDLVIAISVFSHLARDSSEAWLRELVRVSRPGGTMLLTAAGALTLLVISRQPDAQEFFGIDTARAHDYLRRLEAECFIHHEMRPQELRDRRDVESTWGHVFFTREFAEERWSRHAKIVGYVPASLGMFQDFYVLRT